MQNARQFDRTPHHEETLGEYIDRTILGRPASRLWYVWGWPAPQWGWLYPRPISYIEASWVQRPADHRVPMVNHLFQSVGSDFSGASSNGRTQRSQR